MKKALAGLMIASMLLLTSCNDNQLGQLENALHTIILAEGTVQTAVIQANNTVPPTIDGATAVSIMQVMIRLDKATKEAVVATQGVAKLDDKTANNLLGILSPVLAAVDTSVNDPKILGIKDQSVRDKVRLALISVQTSLLTSQTILLASKKK